MDINGNVDLGQLREITTDKLVAAQGTLRLVYPSGGTIYVRALKSSHSARLLIACDADAMTGGRVPVTMEVADALKRRFMDDRNGFFCRADEFPELITIRLSVELYHEPHRLTVEWM